MSGVTTPEADWEAILARVEALEDAPANRELVRRFWNHWHADRGIAPPGIHFYTPSFKTYSSSEIASCGKNAWPAISITGSECKLQCDHCKAKVLEPMIAARTPQDLWRVVNCVIADGARGMLLTGGSNHRNEVEYDPFYPTIRRIRDTFPDFKIAAHTALVDTDIARRMEDSGIDIAMMDVIGAQETVTQVYHLKRPVEDFERSLEALVGTRMKVVPHIVIGLHYGHLLGERNALDVLSRHTPDAAVLVVAMPLYAPRNRPFATPNPHEVGRFFLDARAALPNIPLVLGCARPQGVVKTLIDAYAVMAGFNGMAHPSDGVVELAVRIGRRVRVSPACCSVAVGDEVMAFDSTNGFEPDVEEVIRQERERRLATCSIGGIKAVSAAGGCGKHGIAEAARASGTREQSVGGLSGKADDARRAPRATDA